MSKRLLIILVSAGIIIAFVVSRFVGVDSELSLTGSEEETTDTPESVFQTWVPFEPKDQQFSISFPRPPAHVTEHAHDAFGMQPKKYDIYAADGLDHIAYMIEVISFPEGPDPESDQQILENTLKDILSHGTQNSLEDSQDKSFKGQKALSFNIDSGDRKLNGVIFVQNQTLYILTRIAPDDYADENEDYQFFIDSFQSNEQDKQKDPS
jgi:hypothetical protein